MSKRPSTTRRSIVVDFARGIAYRREQAFPRSWSRGPLYVELGDGLLVWIGRLRFKANLRIWWARA